MTGQMAKLLYIIHSLVIIDRLMIIYESKHFIVESREKPHIDRLDGGHVVINPKIHRDTLEDLNSDEADELMRLMIATGKAMRAGLGKSGIELWNINYQCNANFNRTFHFHLYGRSVNAKQHPIHTCIQHGPTYDEFKRQIEGLMPLTEEDILNIRAELVKIWEK